MSARAAQAANSENRYRQTGFSKKEPSKELMNEIESDFNLLISKDEKGKYSLTKIVSEEIGRLVTNKEKLSGNWVD